MVFRNADGTTAVQAAKRGPKFKFTTKHELTLLMYTEFCWERSIPKMQDMLKAEVVEYMEMEGIANTFKNHEPSKYFTYISLKQYN